MTSEQICHLPHRFINGRQRCRRCGTVLEVEARLAQKTSFWVCRNIDGTEGEFVGPPAAFQPHQRKCDERPWLDSMAHIAGEQIGGVQPCQRCGEDLAWLFFSEPLSQGTEVTINLEGVPGEDVKQSGSTRVPPGTPLCG